MKKATALALTGLMAISGAAGASMSRQNGFGVSKTFVDDVQNIWTLPAVTASNANATYFEFGTVAAAPGAAASTGYSGYAAAANAWGGAHMALGPGVLGIWGGRPFSELNNLAAFTVPTANGGGGAPSAVLLVPSQTVDLLYGFNIGDGLALGIGINRATNGVKTEVVTNAGTTVNEQSSSDFGVSLGADLKNLGSMDLQLGLQFNMPAYVNTNNNGTITNKITGAGSDIDFRAAADLKGDKGHFQKIDLAVNIDSLSAKSEPGNAAPANSYLESKNSAMAWSLGWADGMSGDKGMGLGGFLLSGMSQSRDEAWRAGNEVNKRDASNLNLAFVCAGEAKVKDWLSARAGLSTNLFGTNAVVTEVGAAGSTVKTTVTNQNLAASTITTGASLMFGDITIDGVLNQDILFTGPYFVSGLPAGLFSQVSATWGWGGSKE